MEINSWEMEWDNYVGNEVGGFGVDGVRSSEIIRLEISGERGLESLSNLVDSICSSWDFSFF